MTLTELSTYLGAYQELEQRVTYDGKRPLPSHIYGMRGCGMTSCDNINNIKIIFEASYVAWRVAESICAHLVNRYNVSYEYFS